MTFYDDAVTFTAKYLKSEFGINKLYIDTLAGITNSTSVAAMYDLAFDNDAYEEKFDNGYDTIADEMSIVLSDNIQYSKSELESLTSSLGIVKPKEIEMFEDWCDAQGISFTDEEYELIENVDDGNDVLNLIKSNADIYDAYAGFVRDTNLLDAFSVYGDTIVDSNVFWSDVYNQL